MKLTALILAAAALSAPPASLQSEIKDHLDTVLIDGASARFRWQPVKSPRVYCAHVNSRNRMGGYTGWRLFYVMTDGRPLNAVFDGTIDLASTVCRENGYQVTP